jgi:hypothetical protein
MLARFRRLDYWMRLLKVFAKKKPRSQFVFCERGPEC